MRMGLPRLNRKIKLILSALAFLLLLFYVEVLTYIINTNRWTDLRNKNSDDEDPLRVLLVGDPQIQGENNEPPFLGLFTRWDADRYLQRNYKLAKYHVQPDVVIFLGDLFDEGSIATDPEYRRYYRRFADIFELPRKQDPPPSPTIDYLFIPGDNDVGGEGSEPVDSVKLKWFNQTFGDFKKMFQKYNVQFYKMNLFVPEEYQDPLKNTEHVFLASESHLIRILISHNSLLQFMTNTVQKIVTELRPQLIFSAHSHVSSYIQLENNGPKKNSLHVAHKFLMSSGSGEESGKPISTTIRLNLMEKDAAAVVHEIHVPTCSYRMGVPHMGFGAFLLYKNGTLDYSVLWLPSRFNQLYLYIGIYLLMKISLISFVVAKIFFYLWSFRQRLPEKYQKV